MRTVESENTIIYKRVHRVIKISNDSILPACFSRGFRAPITAFKIPLFILWYGVLLKNMARHCNIDKIQPTDCGWDRMLHKSLCVDSIKSASKCDHE